MIPYRRGISGIRGTAHTLSIKEVYNYSMAFGTVIKELSKENTILIGQDTRATSTAYRDYVIKGLKETGFDVIDLDIVPIHTLQLTIDKLGAAGGIAITASHNPKEYNGVKLLHRRKGYTTYLDLDTIKEVFAVHDFGSFTKGNPGKYFHIKKLDGEFKDINPHVSNFFKKKIKKNIPKNHRVLDYHIHKLLNAMGDKEIKAIKSKEFRVAIDNCGGAVIPLSNAFLDLLGCYVKPYNNEQGEFEREIEPAPKYLEDFCNKLKDKDVAFAVDCDGDRLAVISNVNGKYIPLKEEYTLALAVDHFLQNTDNKKIVTNWSTSMMLDDIVKKYNGKLYRVPTGEIFTVKKMIEENAKISGEGSSQRVIDNRVGYGADALVALWHILSSMVNEKISDRIKRFPKYYNVNGKYDVRKKNADSLICKLRDIYENKKNYLKFIKEDGFLVYYGADVPNSRIHIRKSNTEPIIRIRAEAKTIEKAQMLFDEAIEKIKSNIKQKPLNTAFYYKN